MNTIHKTEINTTMFMKIKITIQETNKLDNELQYMKQTNEYKKQCKN